MTTRVGVTYMPLLPIPTTTIVYLIKSLFEHTNGTSWTGGSPDGPAIGSLLGLGSEGCDGCGGCGSTAWLRVFSTVSRSTGENLVPSMLLLLIVIFIPVI